MKDGGICRFVPRVPQFVIFHLPLVICHWLFGKTFLSDSAVRLVGWGSPSSWSWVGAPGRCPTSAKIRVLWRGHSNLVVAAAPFPTSGPAVRDAPRRNGVLTDTFCSRALRQARASLRIPRRPY